eukprot:403361959
MGNNIFSQHVYPTDPRGDQHDQQDDNQPQQQQDQVQQDQPNNNDQAVNNANNQAQEEQQEQQEEWEDQSGNDDEEEEDNFDDDEEDDDDDNEESKASSNQQQEEEEKGSKMEYGCQHYRRGCQKKCPECEEFFPCRFCHDDAKYLNEKDIKKSHQINRHAVNEIKCMKCDTIQKVQQNCENCGLLFARYMCEICKFFDDEYEKKKVFHCEECGICRVGGKENNYHCKICGCCYNIKMKDTHDCKPAKLNNDCAVCMMDLFTSRDAPNFLRCGHSLHSKCFSTYARKNIACPICRKSMVDPKSFEAQLDLEIANTPMPEEYKNIDVTISCNDCNTQSQVKFHIVGHKCQQCASYNTSQIKN